METCLKPDPPLLPTLVHAENSIIEGNDNIGEPEKPNNEPTNSNSTCDATAAREMARCGLYTGSDMNNVPTASRVNRVWLIAGILLLHAAAWAQIEKPFRPPAVPLIMHDPYFCIWSAADRLTDLWPTHWTGKRHAMQSMVRIDGQIYRLMGPEPADRPAMPQASLDVLPTRTIYTFKTEQVQLSLTFTTPALPDDLDLLARPLTYLTYEVVSLDGQPHTVSVYFDASAELTVNTPDQAVTGSRPHMPGLDVLQMGCVDQNILAKKGDDLRIDWGYAYVATPRSQHAQCAIGAAAAMRQAFMAGQPLPAQDDLRQPRPAREDMPVMAFTLDLGTVADRPVSRFLMVAYDDLYSIKYFSKRLRPYWRRNGQEAADILQAAARDYASLLSRCQAFDQELIADLERIGGAQYARLCALAYRQTLAGNKLVADANRLPLLFPKENFSNGCMATVDVIYPMLPQFLLFSPTLAKAALVPVLDYAASPRWRFPFAPHDLGTYPIAAGQVYGGGELTEDNQMPVEESGNMILLIAAIAKIEGNADFAARYWPLLSRWAEYLRSKGFDPENQLCTDDFAGHLAHNVNLSAKAICALAAYAMLCEMRGQTEQAATYRKTAEEFAARWMKDADDGDHYRLAFDKPGTWSQKYNLVWDRILGLKLFHNQVMRKEMAFYRKVQNRYGLPLDNRRDYTKLDWIIWSATLTGVREDFEALVAPVYRFLQESPSRVPMTDWYWTTRGTRVGFQARPVVGAVFIKLMDDSATWKKWAGRAQKVSGNWAPLPPPPQYTTWVPTAQKEPVTWRYTFQPPADGWFKVGFDDSNWKTGSAGFGAKGTPSAVVRTDWLSSDIWIRREFNLPDKTPAAPHLLIHHDEDAEVYINGILAAKLTGYTTSYDEIEISPQARAALKPGTNTLAVHCRQTGGGQYIDVGIVEVK